MEQITVGEILKPQGIQGELKVRPLTDDVKRFEKLKVVYIGQTAYKLSSVRFDDKFVFIKFVDIVSRNQAEALSGKMLTIDRVNAVPLNDGSFFICDVIGSDIYFENGEHLGKVTAVDSFGAADVFTISTMDNRVARFPFLKKLIEKVDIADKKIVIKKNVFDEVSIYED